MGNTSTAQTSLRSGARHPYAGTTPPQAPPVPRRTTVMFSPEALEIVERFREATGLSLSDAVSELIERSEPRQPRIKWVDGLPMADIPLTGKWITSEDVVRAEAELW